MSRINFLITTMVTTLLIAGCDMKMFDFGSKPEPAQGNKPDHEGWNITVALDGKNTLCGKKVDGLQLWDVEPVSGNPAIKISFNDAKLGKFASMEISINPVISGKAELQTIYQPRQRLTEIAKEIKLSEFDLFANGSMTKVASLPPGQYRVKVSVFGDKDRDCQTIVMAVK